MVILSKYNFRLYAIRQPGPDLVLPLENTVFHDRGSTISDDPRLQQQTRPFSMAVGGWVTFLFSAGVNPGVVQAICARLLAGFDNLDIARSRIDLGMIFVPFSEGHFFLLVTLSMREDGLGRRFGHKSFEPEGCSVDEPHGSKVSIADQRRRASGYRRNSIYSNAVQNYRYKHKRLSSLIVWEL